MSVHLKSICILVLAMSPLAQIAVAADSNTNQSSIIVNVPGNANPWLAGMTNGSVAGNKHDIAPDQSPTQLQGFSSGAVLTFSVAGGVGNAPERALQSADGDATRIFNRRPGAENGIADLRAPADALIGVFLDDDSPDVFPAPAKLDFESAASRDFLTLAPALRQPFFIGDGKTSAGDVQMVVAPKGATRLFLGVMDSWGWSDNHGSFTVTVAVQSPSVR